MASVCFPAGGSLYYTVLARSGEGGWETGHSTRERGVLHRTRCETVAVVWEEVITRRISWTMYVTLCIPRFFSFSSFFRYSFELTKTIDENVESQLVTAANKELAYLQQFGQPLLPF